MVALTADSEDRLTRTLSRVIRNGLANPRYTQVCAIANSLLFEAALIEGIGVVARGGFAAGTGKSNAHTRSCAFWMGTGSYGFERGLALTHGERGSMPV